MCPLRLKPLPAPEYIIHSQTLFDELNLSSDLVHDESFSAYSLQISRTHHHHSNKLAGLRATRYPFMALNTFNSAHFRLVTATAMVAHYPFAKSSATTKDGKCSSKELAPHHIAVVVMDGLFYASSVREFLAQELMHALGIPTSRSLTLYASHHESVMRPWYSEGSCAVNPDTMVSNAAAIATRVAPSFLRVGQIELFARRARTDAHADAHKELSMIVEHVIEREYATEIDRSQPFEQQIVSLAEAFRHRLCHLVSQWVRVGYCKETLIVTTARLVALR